MQYGGLWSHLYANKEDTNTRMNTSETSPSISLMNRHHLTKGIQKIMTGDEPFRSLLDKTHCGQLTAYSWDLIVHQQRLYIYIFFGCFSNCRQDKEG